MGVLFNRQDDEDVIESGIYQVPEGKAVHIGYPVKANGSIAAEYAPPYTTYVAVEDYDDTDSTDLCIGVSEDQIPESLSSPALRNIEFRHLRRDVAVCKKGVRMMKNMESSTAAQDGARVMPYPGGFKIWTTGKSILGVVKRGPIAAGKNGMIMVEVDNVQS